MITRSCRTACVLVMLAGLLRVTGLLAPMIGCLSSPGKTEVVVLGTLTRKIIWGGGALLVGVALAAAFGIANILRIHTAADHLASHVSEPAVLSGQFNTYIFRSITEARSYVQTHDPADRAEALDELQAAHTILDQLASDTSQGDFLDLDDEPAQADLQRQRIAVLNTVEAAVHRLLQAVEANDPSALTHAQDDFSAVEDNAEPIEARSHDLANRSMTTATTTMNAVIQREIVLTVAWFGIFALAVLGLLLFVRQTIVRPITQLSTIAQTVADGDLDQIIAVTNNDEIGSLQASFNHMISSLHMARETVAEYQTTLEARVAERTAELDAVNRHLQVELAERIQAQAALQQREAYFRALIERSADGIALLGSDGTIRYGSPATTHILGYEVAAFVGQTALDLVHPEDRPQVADQLAWISQDLYTAMKLQARVQHADGSWRDLEGMVTNLLDDPAVGAIVTNYRDITERKQIEHALDEERALLARRVEERTADLRAANQQLGHAARLKDEFLASMSHELRTPLNTILGMTETLQEGIFGTTTAAQAKAVRHVEESGRHLLALINDILDVSKIEAGKFDLNVEEVELAQVAQASLRLVTQLARQKNLQLVSSLDSTIGMLQADARRLKQMLANLLSNAVKFTPEGGRIGLTVVGDAAAQVVRLTVWDTGIGIAADDLSHLFQPFIQLDSRLAREYTGSGLGLALVKQMAELHGGSVSVESILGEGSQFTITLPWTARLPVAKLSAPDAQIARSAGEHAAIERALIIEDSPTASAQLARYLHDLGAAVRVHPCGVGAFEAALEVNPDVILLDIQLPDFSGWDVLVRLKADVRVSGIPVVVVSVVDDRPKGMALGAAAYLVKPISREQVRDALDSLHRDGAFSIRERAPIGAPDQLSSRSAPVILLAEDEEHNRYTLSTYLEAKGYQLVVARNGAEVLDQLHETTPDLILMDIQMPRMDGLEAMQRVRSDPTIATVPIIALTALAMPGDRERCLAAGADDVLTKPVSLKGLAAAIEVRLQRAAGSHL